MRGSNSEPRLGNYSASPAPITHKQKKSYYVSGTKVFSWKYIEINRHLISKCFKNAVFGRQESIQCKCKSFFWHQTEKCWLENFVKSERFLAVLREHIIFNVKWVEVHKIKEVFLSKALLQNEWPFPLIFVGFKTFC